MVRIADWAKVTGFCKHCDAVVFQGQVLDTDDKDTSVFRIVGNCQPTWRNIPEELNLHAVKPSHLPSKVICYCELQIICTCFRSGPFTPYLAVNLWLATGPWVASWYIRYDETCFNPFPAKTEIELRTYFETLWAFYVWKTALYQ